MCKVLHIPLSPLRVVLSRDFIKLTCDPVSLLLLSQNPLRTILLTQQEREAESEQVEVQSDPDFVVLEEVTYPSLQETKQIGSSSAEGEVLVDQPELILEDTKHKQFMPDT